MRLPRHPRPWSPVLIQCFTCAHVRPEVAPGAAFAHGTCALGLIDGGQAVMCWRYEREPGSDDETVWMAKPPARVDEELAAPPKRPGYSAHYKVERTETEGERIQRMRAAEAAAFARKPGRWQIVGVAT